MKPEGDKRQLAHGDDQRVTGSSMAQLVPERPLELRVVRPCLHPGRDENDRPQRAADGGAVERVTDPDRRDWSADTLADFENA